MFWRQVGGVTSWGGRVVGGAETPLLHADRYPCRGWFLTTHLVRAAVATEVGLPAVVDSVLANTSPTWSSCAGSDGTRIQNIWLNCSKRHQDRQRSATALWTAATDAWHAVRGRRTRQHKRLVCLQPVSSRSSERAIRGFMRQYQPRCCS